MLITITDESNQLVPVCRLQVYFCLQGDAFAIKFPQETHCFTKGPGTHDIKVTTDTEEHGMIYMRIFSKRMYKVERK